MYEFLMNCVKEIKYFPLYPHSAESDFDLLPNDYKSCSIGRGAGTGDCHTGINQLISLSHLHLRPREGQRGRRKGGKKRGRE
jgi:hypothetical protein